MRRCETEPATPRGWAPERPDFARAFGDFRGIIQLLDLPRPAPGAEGTSCGPKPPPAIIIDPMTTVVVPPGRSMELDAYRILHYRDITETDR